MTEYTDDVKKLIRVQVINPMIRYTRYHTLGLLSRGTQRDILDVDGRMTIRSQLSCIIGAFTKGDMALNDHNPMKQALCH